MSSQFLYKSLLVQNYILPLHDKIGYIDFLELR
jgi:hypothetical protein